MSKQTQNSYRRVNDRAHLSRLVRDTGLSQRALAVAVGIDKGVIERLFAGGSQDILARNAEAIETYFAVPLGTLFRPIGDDECVTCGCTCKPKTA